MQIAIGINPTVLQSIPKGDVASGEVAGKHSLLEHMVLTQASRTIWFCAGQQAAIPSSREELNCWVVVVHTAVLSSSHGFTGGCWLLRTVQRSGLEMHHPLLFRL